MEDDFKASVAVSRQWEGDAVAREIVNGIKEKVSDPKFILLFTTIHYESEFKSILNGIKDEFPDAPLVGGTVAGFMCQEGCYTRGVSALAVDYSNMDVAVGVGHNTKRNPKKALSSALEKMDFGSCDSKSKIIIELVSGPTIPSFPLVGRKTILEKSLTGKIVSKLFFLTSFLNTGIDKADEIIDRLNDKLPNWKILGGCLMDTGSLRKNYQFEDDNVNTNSLNLLSICSDLNINLHALQGLEPTGEKVNANKLSKDRRIIKEIDGRNAADEYLKRLGTNFNFLGSMGKVFRTTFYYPMTYKKRGVYHPCVVGPIINGELVVGNKIEKNELEFYSLSGAKVLSEFSKKLEEITDENPSLMYCVICQTMLESFGKKIYDFQEKLGKFDIPFLGIFTAGESICNDETPHHIYESFNILSFGSN